MTFLLEKFIVFKMGFNLAITWYSLERARTFKCSACQIWVLQNGRGLYQQGWRQHRGQLRGEQNRLKDADVGSMLPAGHPSAEEFVSWTPDKRDVHI